MHPGDSLLFLGESPHFFQNGVVLLTAVSGGYKSRSPLMFETIRLRVFRPERLRQAPSALRSRVVVRTSEWQRWAIRLVLTWPVERS